jgi:biopolymer transport protein ExbB/TolQ
MGLYLKDILHLASQSMLYPTIAIVLLLIVFIIFSIGAIIAEVFTERRHFKLVMPVFLNKLDDAAPEDIPEVVEESALLRNQKVALLTLFENSNLPEESRFALAKRLISDEEGRYKRIVSRTDLAAKVGPMLGLMGTLIPLGPGIVALGQGDTSLLSSSLLIAFDTTTAGLACSAVSLVISLIRKRWYADYMVALKACMSTALEKIEILEAEGKTGKDRPLIVRAADSADTAQVAVTGTFSAARKVTEVPDGAAS